MAYIIYTIRLNNCVYFVFFSASHTKGVMPLGKAKATFPDAEIENRNRLNFELARVSV